MLYSVVKPCKHDTDWTLLARTIKLGAHTSYDKRMTHIDFQGQRSKVKVITIHLLLSIEQKVKPFYIANYDVISLLYSPVGRILQRLHCSCWLLWRKKPLNGFQRNLIENKISTSSLMFVFFVPIKKKKQDDRSSLWLAETFSTSPLKPLNRFQRNLTENKISTSSTMFEFFGPIGKSNGCPFLWLAETFLTSLKKPLNGIQETWQESRS